MYKLFVLAALFAVAAARPGYLGASHLAYSAPVATTTYVQPTYVGSVVKTIPTAVSHQSVSQIHSGAHYVQPIVAPVIKTYSAPAVYKTYAHAAPVVKTVVSPVVQSYAAAPLVSSAYSTYETAPVLKTYGGAYGYGSHAYGGAW